tara:strand:+ start:3650 stop:4549 length:900 start_codon:yes stop_codon:yes gene_type:complete
MKNFEKPIIISGMPRTGTTPLGRILSSLDDFSMIYEPFNAKQGITSIDFNYPFPGNNISEIRFNSIFNDLIYLKSKFKTGILTTDSILKKIFKYCIGNESSISFKKVRLLSNNSRLIIKDPFLIFSSAELSKNYKVIICERPLKPLASSFKRMNWNFTEYEKLSKFFSENELKAKNLKPSKRISSEVVGAIQFYELVNLYKSKINDNENLYYFSQNRLVEDPITEVKDLFEWLELEFSKNVEKTIIELKNDKNSNNKFPRKNIQHDIEYNKKFSNKYFIEVLTLNEIELIEAFCSGGEI